MEKVETFLQGIDQMTKNHYEIMTEKIEELEDLKFVNHEKGIHFQTLMSMGVILRLANYLKIMKCMFEKNKRIIKQYRQQYQKSCEIASEKASEGLVQQVCSQARQNKQKDLKSIRNALKGYRQNLEETYKRMEEKRNQKWKEFQKFMLVESQKQMSQSDRPFKQIAEMDRQVEQYPKISLLFKQKLTENQIIRKQNNGSINFKPVKCSDESTQLCSKSKSKKQLKIVSKTSSCKKIEIKQQNKQTFVLKQSNKAVSKKQIGSQNNLEVQQDECIRTQSIEKQISETKSKQIFIIEQSMNIQNCDNHKENINDNLTQKIKKQSSKSQQKSKQLKKPQYDQVSQQKQKCKSHTNISNQNISPSIKLPTNIPKPKKLLTSKKEIK